MRIKMYFIIFLLFCSFHLSYCIKSKAVIQLRPSSKYDNPNFIRDRHLDEILKPMMDQNWKNRYRKPYHPAWMDYCDPYHCNDYHKIACGLNRRTMRFKWFQSQCHIILNNMCATFRGNLRYDVVETKFCSKYVMFARTGCPEECPDVISPVCALSTVDGHVILFKNACAMKLANCQEDMLEEYDAVDLKVCQGLLFKLLLLK